METKISPQNIRAARIAACKQGIAVKKAAFDQKAPGFITDLSHTAKEDTGPNSNLLSEFVNRRIEDWKAYTKIIRQETEINRRERATNRNPVLPLCLGFRNNE